MDTMYHFQSLLLGLMGWTATVIAITNTTRFSSFDQRMMIICSWMFWMIPSMWALVYRSIITPSTAAIICGLSTLLIGVIVFASGLRRRAH